MATTRKRGSKWQCIVRRDGRPFDDDAASELCVDEMSEETFTDIVAWMQSIGLVHVIDADNGTRPRWRQARDDGPVVAIPLTRAASGPTHC